MGCWDIFCFICGNTCHEMSENLLETLTEDMDRYNNEIRKPTKLSKNKSLMKELKSNFDYYSNPNAIKNIKKLIKNTEWMNNCTFLSAFNDIIHKCQEASCNIEFVTKDRSFIHYIIRDVNQEDYHSHGVFLHTDCWKFIKNKYGIELKYSDLPILDTERKSPIKIFDFVNYGLIQNYWGQDFDFLQLIMDGNEELCMSPLEVNNKNIPKVFSKLKIKMDRTGPSTSATFYDENTMKIGNNEKFWIIKKNKWTEIKHEIVEFTIIVNKNNRFFKSLNYLGEASMKPVFIKSLKYKNNKVTVTILTFINILDMVKSKLK